MCVKIAKNNQLINYDCNKNLIDQTKDSTEVIVNYTPNDKEIDKFLKDFAYCSKVGIDPKLNIKVHYGDYLNGFKVKKLVKNIMNDININEFIKLMTLTQLKLDRILEEISLLCKK